MISFGGDPMGISLARGGLNHKSEIELQIENLSLIREIQLFCSLSK